MKWNISFSFDNMFQAANRVAREVSLVGDLRVSALSSWLKIISPTTPMFLAVPNFVLHVPFLCAILYS